MNQKPGITPARAGKRSAPACRRMDGGDHPRACGEKRIYRIQNIWRQGSPPRVRGKGGIGMSREPDAGITPARAGKSLYQRRARIQRRDHPRACGEKYGREKRIQLYSGSPPRVRGKDPSGRNVGDCTGITPARAGKSSSAGKRRTDDWDHPRACGEKIIYGSGIFFFQGSPPRVRGKVNLPR